MAYSQKVVDKFEQTLKNPKISLSLQKHMQSLLDKLETTLEKFLKLVTEMF